MATKKKAPRRKPLSEHTVTALLMRAAEWSSEGPYPLLSREWLASSDQFDDPAARELADKLIAAYAAEHPPVADAEAIADAVDWKITLGGFALMQERGISLERARRELLAKARSEVADEVDKSPEAVKLDHVRRRKRVKHRP